MATTLPHWSGRQVPLAQSKGGVWAVCNVWDNFLRSGLATWPPPELVQKLYQSRQARAFEDDQLAAVTTQLGYYCDLQSVHSEDAVTWNLFGPLVYGAQHTRDAFARHVFRLLQIPGAETDHTLVWLWRRIPHPDSNVPGGPEIDFGLLTANALVLGEAKWQSPVGQGQGVLADKTQIQLREEFCEKFGHALFPTVEHFVVLGLDLQGTMVKPSTKALQRGQLHLCSATWQALAESPELPHGPEFLKQLAWRIRHSRGQPRDAKL